MTARAPRLSVIVAAVEGAAIRPTLDTLSAQRAGRDIEIVLVSNPDHAEVAAAARHHSDVRVLVRPVTGLVPHLWGYAMAHTTSDIVALTITGCVPDSGWLDAVLTAHRGGEAAVGGPIIQDLPAPVADRALCFARYSAYLPPVSAGSDAEVPGDNGSYKRAAIEDQLPTIATDGFWEAAINATLRARGWKLRMDPAMRMIHTHSLRPRLFCQQRWRHGRIFGATRARSLSWPGRIARTAAAPAILVVMAARAGGHARRARLFRQFIPALPWVLVFYACWVAGESVGLLTGSS